MGLFVLLLLLFLAAAAGILGAVLKATLVIVLSLVATVVVLVWLASWYVRRRVLGFQREVEHRFDDARRRRAAYDVTSEEASRRSLGEGP